MLLQETLPTISPELHFLVTRFWSELEVEVVEAAKQTKIKVSKRPFLKGILW